MKKRLGLLTSVIGFIVGGFAAYYPKQNVLAADCFDYQYYSDSDIMFYLPVECESGGGSGGSGGSGSGSFNPCYPGGGGDLGAAAPTSLVGADNAGKIWNYLRARGLTQVATAGVMGNLFEESGLNPYVGESGSTSWDPDLMGVGFGLIQWTNTEGNSGVSWRRRNVINYLKENGVATPDLSQADQALLLELNWLWDGERGGMTWQEQLNAETKIEGNTAIASNNPGYNSDKAGSQVGNGSTLLFHDLVERSNDTPAMLQERIDQANRYYEQYSVAENEVCNQTGNVVDTSGKVATIFPDGLPSSASQMGGYLVTINVPILGNDDGWNITIHKNLADEFRAVFSEMKAIGFPIKTDGGEGCYNWRQNVNSPGNLSQHSFGVACDINVVSNPNGAASAYPGIDEYSVTPEVVQIWKNHGFSWGGDFSRVKDPMHFSWLGG